MELAVGASDSAMRSLLGKLGSLLAQEYKRISSVRSEIQYIKDELTSMHAFLRNLNYAATDDHDEQTKDWMEQVRDVAYDIEDCVDDFSHRLRGQPRGEGLLADIRRAWYAMTTVWERRSIATKIVDLKDRAQGVGERRTRYGVKDPGPDAAAKASTRPTPSYHTNDHPQPAPQLVSAAEPVGMEEAIEQLGPWLTEGSNDHLKVLAIVGFGGLGKTTLALALQRKFGEKFESRASVQASQKLNRVSLLRSILKQVVPKIPDGVDEWGLKKLEEELKTHLEKKSIFPKGYSINRKRLVRRWIAGGFIIEKHGKTVEEVAEDYFNELISRNIIRPVDHNSNGKVKTYQVHDMILEYIVSKSSKENFITVLGGHWHAATPGNKVRRLSLHSSDPDSAKSEIENMNLSHVRSLTAFDSLERLQSFSFKFGILQVLDLEGCKGLTDIHLRKICKMFHLKYLSLRKANIKKLKLPSAIGKLIYLETLDIRETNVEVLPESVADLKQMAHLLGGNKSTRAALRFTDGIAKMTALQTLSGIGISQKSSKALGGMHTKLRKLSIYSIADLYKDNQKYGDLLSAIEYLSGCSLKYLAVDDGFTGFLDLVVSSSTPPKYIHTLELSGKLPKVPQWINELEKLTLSLTSLRTHDLFVLAQLPLLFSLTFSVNAARQDHSVMKVFLRNTMDSRGNILIPSDGFNSLRLLRFSAPVLPLLSFLEGAMAKLQRLELRFMVLEGAYGLENLVSIQQVLLRVGQQASETTKVKVSDIRSSVRMHPNKPTVVVDEYY